MGQGIEPDDSHPLADKMSDEELDKFLSSIRTNINKTVETLQPRKIYFQLLCCWRKLGPEKQ